MNFDLALDFAFYSVNDLIFNSFCTFLQKKSKASVVRYFVLTSIQVFLQFLPLGSGFDFHMKLKFCGKRCNPWSTYTNTHVYTT